MESYILLFRALPTKKKAGVVKCDAKSLKVEQIIQCNAPFTIMEYLPHKKLVLCKDTSGFFLLEWVLFRYENQAIRCDELKTKFNVEKVCYDDKRNCYVGRANGTIRSEIKEIWAHNGVNTECTEEIGHGAITALDARGGYLVSNSDKDSKIKIWDSASLVCIKTLEDSKKIESLKIREGKNKNFIIFVQHKNDICIYNFSRRESSLEGSF